MPCVGCPGEQFTKAGRDRQGRQRYRCTACGQRQTERSASAFSGYRFGGEIERGWQVKHRSGALACVILQLWIVSLLAIAAGFALGAVVSTTVGC
jgi:hypothetical protein